MPGAVTKILIVEAPYYTHISDLMRDGVLAVLNANDVAYDIVQVAGALEIPGAISMADTAKNLPFAPKYDGYIGLGCVIRGETTHYDYVCEESCRGLMDLTLRNIPVSNGILTVENEEQALARADKARKNKGGDVANAVLGMIAWKKKLGLA